MLHTKFIKYIDPGLLESVYETVLAYELEKRGLQIKRQVPIKIRFEDIVFDEGFCADILVEDKVIAELKSVEKVRPVYKKQLLTHLRLSNRKLGLLINFNEELIKNGITRIVNGLEEEYY